MADAVQAGAALVVGVHHPPGGLLDVGVFEHVVLGAGVVDPAPAGLQVHRAQFPAFGRVDDAALEAALLLLVADREPVFDQHDARAHQHAFEFRAGAQELEILLLGAEAHDPFDAGAVVPAAIEQDHFAGRRQMRDIALEVPLGLFPLGRRAQRHHPAHAGVQTRGDALDGAALAGGVAAFEDHHDAQPFGLDPLLQLDQLDLQIAQFVLVELHRQLGLAALLHDIAGDGAVGRLRLRGNGGGCDNVRRRVVQRCRSGLARRLGLLRFLDGFLQCHDDGIRRSVFRLRLLALLGALTLVARHCTHAPASVRPSRTCCPIWERLPVMPLAGRGS